MTTEIYDDADTLWRLVCPPQKSVLASLPKEENILEAARELFAANKNSLVFVDKASKECAPLSFGALKNKVYKQEVVVRMEQRR